MLPIIRIGRIRSYCVTHTISLAFLVFACNPQQKESTKSVAPKKSIPVPEKEEPTPIHEKKPVAANHENNDETTRSNESETKTDEHSTEREEKAAKSPKVRPHDVERILTAKLSTDKDQLGYDDSEPGDRKGPSSFTVDEDERIYIVDPVNSRIRVFNKGKKERDISTPSWYFADIGFLPSGDLIVAGGPHVYNHRRPDYEPKLLIMNREGRLKKESLLCCGIGGEMFIQPEGVWVKQVTSLYLAMDALQQNSKCSDNTLPYEMLSRDGKWFIGFRINPDKTSLDVFLCDRNRKLDEHGCDERQASRKTVESIKFDKKIFLWNGGYTDAQGRIYFATSHEWGPAEYQQSKDYVVTLTPDLLLERKTQVPRWLSFGAPDNHIRYMYVREDGTLYMMTYSEDEDRIFVTRFR